MATAINTMPYNRDAEMALLGCLLIDNDIVAELVEKLSEDDFYQEFGERKDKDPGNPFSEFDDKK